MFSLTKDKSLDVIVIGIFSIIMNDEKKRKRKKEGNG